MKKSGTLRTSSRSGAKQARDPATTRKVLLDAAAREFTNHGFEGTDTNRIARAAGFAPQTFYRHFDDKLGVFLALYDQWWRSEEEELVKAGGAALPSAKDAADIALAFHTKWRGFRRALRHLAIVDSRARIARTEARTAQLARFRSYSSNSLRSNASLAASLLKAERILDAAADGELTDLGLTTDESHALVVEALAELLGSVSGPREATRQKRALK